MSLIWLFDEDSMDVDVIDQIERRGYIVTSVGRQQMLRAPDSAVLARAAELPAVVVTYNAKDYCLLHTEWISSGRTHGGILVCPGHLRDVGQRVRLIFTAQAMEDSNPGHFRNQLQFASNYL